MTATTKARAAVRAIKEGNQWGPEATISFLDKRRAFNHFLCAMDFEMRRNSKPRRGK